MRNRELKRTRTVRGFSRALSIVAKLEETERKYRRWTLGEASDEAARRREIVSWELLSCERFRTYSRDAPIALPPTTVSICISLSTRNYGTFQVADSDDR